MPQIRDVLAVKGTRIHSISPEATVLQATQLMTEHHIGSLIVMDGGKVAGIFTERDVLRRVVVNEAAPAQVKVRDVMTARVIYCTPDTDIEDASRILKDARIRHLPVLDGDGKLIGIISIGDLNAFYASNQQQQLCFLQDYIYGRA